MADRTDLEAVEPTRRTPGNAWGPGTNTGHGHVWDRPDGVRFRCGGEALCAACRKDAVRLDVVSGQTPSPSLTPGVYIAYEADYSGMSVFADELACLRYAVENHMSVKFVEYGGSIR